MISRGVWRSAAAIAVLRAVFVASACPSDYDTWRDASYPATALNDATLSYCIHDSGWSLGMYSAYNFQAPSYSADVTLSSVIKDSAPTLYSINLLGGRFNMSICAAARRASNPAISCGADALSAEDAMELGHKDCADALYNFITAVFQQSEGAWVMDGDKVYIDERQVSGDWPFVAASKSSVLFGVCANDTLFGDAACTAPCPSMGIQIYSLGANYASCPYRGNSRMSLSTAAIPSDLLVQTTGTDSWETVYDNPTALTWSISSSPAPPHQSYSLTIQNDIFDHDLFLDVAFMGAWLFPTFLLNLSVVCMFGFSTQEERRRPFDLVSGVCFCDLTLAGTLIIWWFSGYDNGFDSTDTTGGPQDYIIPLLAQYTILLSWFLYGAVAHDLTQQVRNPFDRGYRISLLVVLGLCLLCALYLVFAFAISCAFTSCNARGYSILLFPWITRKYTHYYSLSSYGDSKSSIPDRFFTLAMLFVLPSLGTILYSMYAYVFGKSALRGGLSFSHAERQRSFIFRKGYLLGHALLWCVLIAAIVMINESGHCLDSTGLKLASVIYAARATWTVVLFLQHAEGPHRRLLRMILEKTRRRQQLARTDSSGERDTELFSNPSHASAVQLSLNPTVHHHRETSLSRQVSQPLAEDAHAHTTLKDEDAVLRAEVVHLVADGVWLSTCHSAQLTLSGRCCSHYEPIDLGHAGLEQKHTFAYPEHGGSVFLESFIDRISGIQTTQGGRYEFSAVNAPEFSRLRVAWYHSSQARLSSAGSPRDSVTFPGRQDKHILDDPCSWEDHDQLHLSSVVSEGDLDDGERFYLKSVEVPDSVEDMAALIKESWNTGGKSGAPLYFSADKRLVIKMINSEEFSFLASYSLEYCAYIEQSCTSLLSRLQGLYTIRMRPQQDLFRFMVMSNAALDCSGWRIFARYDLKGSTSTRTSRGKHQHVRNSATLSSQWTAAGQHHGTLLDLDYEEDSHEFERPIEIRLEDKERLLEQILEDVKFLARNRVMDYSLFVCRAERRLGAPDPVGYHELHCFQSATNSDECFTFSFLDITQEWNYQKAAEQFAKVCLLRRDKYAVSSAPPGYYGNRFVNRMNEYIRPVLDVDHPVMQQVLLTDWEEYNFLDRC